MSYVFKNLKVNKSCRNFATRAKLNFAVKGCGLEYVKHISFEDPSTGRWHAIFESADCSYSFNPTKHGFQIL